MITEKESKETMTTFPSEALIILYSIALFHEKLKFAKWVKEELIKRKITRTELTEFNKNFKGFYNDLINQEDL